MPAASDDIRKKIEQAQAGLEARGTLTEPEALTAQPRPAPLESSVPEGGEGWARLRQGWRAYAKDTQFEGTYFDNALDFALSPSGARLLIEGGVVLSEIGLTALLPEIAAARAAGTIAQMSPAAKTAFKTAYQAARGLAAYGSGFFGSKLAEGVDPTLDPEATAQRTGLANLGGEAFSIGAGFLTRSMLRPFVGGVDESAIAADTLLREHNQMLRPDQISSNTFVRGLDSIADTSLAFGGARTQKREEVARTAAELATDFAEKYTPRMDVDELGEALKLGFDDRKEGWLAYMKSRYRLLDGELEPERKMFIRETNTVHESPILDTRGNPQNITVTERVPEMRITKGGVNFEKVISAAKARLKELPDVKAASDLRGFLGDIIKQDKIMPFEEAHNLRSFFLTYTAPLGVAMRSRLQGVAGNVAKLITLEMDKAGRQINPAATALWREISSEYKAGHQLWNGQLAKAIARREPEAVYQAIVRRRGPGTARKATEIFGENSQEMKAVRGYFMYDLLDTAADGTAISGRKAAVVLKNLGDETVRALMPEGTKKGLEKLVRVLAAVEARPGTHQFQFIFHQAQLGQ